MKLSELKEHLKSITEVNFELPNGTLIPDHFHVTEVGQVIKNFIDCGGTLRSEKAVNFQLWEAGDLDHRLAPQKLANIIELSEKILSIEDAEIEVEYQSDSGSSKTQIDQNRSSWQTIGKYGLDFNGKNFLLTSKQTACLATDACGIAPAKQKIKLSELSVSNNSCCTPGGGCC